MVLLVGGRQVIDGNLSLGDFTAFYTYLVMLAGPMRMLGDGAGHGAAGDRLRQPPLRDPRPRAARSRARPGAPPLPAGRRAASRCAASSLRYDGGRRGPALDATIDLEVEAGRTVALVGPSGSGKTSLVALLARLYDPSEGAVVDRRRRHARASTSARCAREIAFVADDSFLFSATVAENIAYARPDATPRGDRGGGAARPGRRVHPRPARRLRDAWSASAG